MASILTDHILNKLLCSTCKQYLSCGPTKVHSNGNMFCGRCDKEENKSTNSLYDKVSSHLLFPCINRYEGCNKLLQFKDVSQHEKACRGTKFSCPLCPFDPSNQVTLLYLIDHYKSVHGEYFLKEPKFFIDPKVMSENVYLYCDNANNCVFLIKVSCTQDRVTLNACVPKKNTVSHRFRLNNILELPIKEVLCNSWEKEENRYLEAYIPDVLSRQDEQILCEFFYEVLENKTLTVVMDLDSIDEPNRDGKLSKLPKLCLDKEYFPGCNAYKISHCGNKLICENDPNMVIQLKCNSCDTYFWNVPFSPILHEEKKKNYYGLYTAGLVNSHLLVCYGCGYKISKPVFNSPILNLKVCCRFDCGTICCIWEIYLHEQKCDFNFEKDTEKFVKNCFKNITFNSDDRFVRGNYIKSFEFKVGYYEYSDNPYDDEDSEILEYGKSLTSQESIIYGVTEDGYKYIVYYKFSRGSFMVRVEHVYDPSKYVVIIRWMWDDSKTLNERMYLEQSHYTIISEGLEVFTSESAYNGFKRGSNLICETPSFLIIIKKKSQFTFMS